MTSQEGCLVANVSNLRDCNSNLEMREGGKKKEQRVASYKNIVKYIGFYKHMN